MVAVCVCVCVCVFHDTISCWPRHRHRHRCLNAITHLVARILGAKDEDACTAPHARDCQARRDATCTSISDRYPSAGAPLLDRYGIRRVRE
uniref:Putative secreted protein n=1 Tax=Anopheles darlingi TaxID=43151 RepID=A0A2M4D066_ANODA